MSTTIIECDECHGDIRVVYPMDEVYCIPTEKPHPRGDHILKTFSCAKGHTKVLYFIGSRFSVTNSAVTGREGRR